MVEMFHSKAGAYRYMDAYLLSWIIELATDRFCRDFLNYRNDPQGKTSTQMNHAARSGSRNFAEGSERLMTSTSSGLDLLNVAKGSLAELRDDYLKWLMRHDELPWDEPEAVHVRRIVFDLPTPSPSSVISDSPPSHKPFSNRAFCAHVLAQQAKFKTWLEDPKSTVRANALVILCTRACMMMESYIRSLGESFKHEGGFREKMGEARREQRTEGQATEDAHAPQCEVCGNIMRIVRRKMDNNPFWGCSSYPGCRGTRPYAKAGE